MVMEIEKYGQAAAPGGCASCGPKRARRGLGFFGSTGGCATPMPKATCAQRAWRNGVLIAISSQECEYVCSKRIQDILVKEGKMKAGDVTGRWGRREGPGTHRTMLHEVAQKYGMRYNWVDADYAENRWAVVSPPSFIDNLEAKIEAANAPPPPPPPPPKPADPDITLTTPVFRPSGPDIKFTAQGTTSSDDPGKTISRDCLEAAASAQPTIDVLNRDSLVLVKVFSRYKKCKKSTDPDIKNNEAALVEYINIYENKYKPLIKALVERLDACHDKEKKAQLVKAANKFDKGIRQIKDTLNRCNRRIVKGVDKTKEAGEVANKVISLANKERFKEMDALIKIVQKRMIPDINSLIKNLKNDGCGPEGCKQVDILGRAKKVLREAVAFGQKRYKKWIERNKKRPVPGGDVDKHGCKPSAGQSWCEPEKRCIGPSEVCLAPISPQPPPPPPPTPYVPPIPYDLPEPPPPEPAPAPVAKAGMGMFPLILGGIGVLGAVALLSRKED